VSLVVRWGATVKLSLATVKIETVIIILLCGGILPFLVNAAFAHPWTDDFAFAAIAREKGFVDSLHYWYTQITGRYFSVSLMLISPMVFGQLWAYKLLPVLLSLALFGALLFLIAEITQENLSVRGKIILALALVFVYFDQMPDLRSGLYWVPGTFTYLAGAVLLFLLSAVILRLRTRTEAGERRGLVVVGILLGLCLPGTNEVILAILSPALLLFFLYDHLHGRRLDRRLLWIIAAVVVGSGLELLAPGNTLRLGSYAGSRDTLAAGLQAITATYSSLLLWVGTPHLLTLTLLVVCYTRRNQRLQDLVKGIHPGVSSLLLLVFLFACYFPPYWGMGIHPPYRVVNLIYLLFLVGWLLNVVVCTARINPENLGFISRIPIKFVAPPFILYGVVLLALGNSNLVTVTGDLLSGKSYRYDQELQLRNARIKANPAPVCEVEILQNLPASLFFSDIYFVDMDWINRSYADYHGKNSIVLKRIRPSP